MAFQEGSGGEKVYGVLSRWFDLLSSGKTTNLEFSSLFCSATRGQVPRITVLNNRAVLNNILHSHVLAARRRRKVTDITDMNIVSHGVLAFRTPYLKAEANT